MTLIRLHAVRNDVVQRVLSVASTCVEHLNARFGARTPFPVAHLVLAERDGPGYARTNAIVLSAVRADEVEALAA